MPRLLLIEDEAPLRRVLTLNLARHGYTVIEAESVATAREALLTSQNQFDLLLLDINLPDETGWDVLRFLGASRENEQQKGQAMPPSPPVIVLTAVRPAPRRLEEFHPKAVLVKPFPIEALLRLIERALTSKTGKPGGHIAWQENRV
jgi:DNA-binding response OmpR family regulator